MTDNHGEREAGTTHPGSVCRPPATQIAHCPVIVLRHGLSNPVIQNVKAAFSFSFFSFCKTRLLTYNASHKRNVNLVT